MKKKQTGIICIALLMLFGCTREKNDGYFTNQTAYKEKEDGWVHSLLINTVYNNEDEFIRANHHFDGTNMKYKALDDFYGVISDEEGNEIGRAAVPIPAYVYKKEYREEIHMINDFLDENCFYRDITIDDLEPLELSIFDKQEIVDLYNEALDVDTSTKGPFPLLVDANCLQQTLLDGSIIQLSYMSNNRYVTKLNLEYIYSDETYLSDLCEQETATPEQIEVQKDLDELEQRIIETQAYEGIDIDSPIDDRSYFNEQLTQLIDDSLSAKKKMVELYHISKSYGKQNVLTNFTYIFNNKGFYVISGPSGCGKTTLIDIIAGLTNFDTGEYYFNNVQIDGIKDQPYLHNTIAYIAQDTYFINYLTVQENLELVCNNKEILNKCIEEFQIQDLLEQSPITLSGGQRQKLAIIQALVSEKKVIVLDEPTSSLDEEGKHKIFELLKKISTDTLVICVTHDREVYSYADEIIDFMNLNLEDKDRNIKENIICKKEAIYKENNLNHYTDKLRHYKKRETLSSRILFLIFSIFLLLVMSTYNIENKVVESMMERYHMNYLNVYVPIEQYDTFYNDLETNWDINSVVYTYGSGADYIKRPDCIDCVTSDTEPYVRTLLYETIPTGDIFYYHDYLAYGSYFENAYEIMLGYEKAKELSSNIEKLVGKDIVIDTPKGKETFKITGIFKEFNDKEIPYFQNGFDTESINNNIYFNNKYTEQYKEDGIVSSLEIANKKSEFVIYFNQPSQITEYIKQYGNLDNLMDDTSIVAKPVENYLFSLIQKVENIIIILYPCLITALILIMLFYIQTKIFELHQSMNTLCVYLYYGYEWKTIIKAYRSYYFKEIIRITGSAVCISILIAFIINLLDLTVYPIFTVSIPLVLFTACILGSVCYMNIKFILSRLKKNEWFSIMKERRDLL